MWLVWQCRGVTRAPHDPGESRWASSTTRRTSSSDAVDQHGDKISDGIDKAAALADEKTGGKHTDKIDSGADKAKDALDKLDGKNDDLK